MGLIQVRVPWSPLFVGKTDNFVVLNSHCASGGKKSSNSGLSSFTKEAYEASDGETESLPNQWNEVGLELAAPGCTRTVYASFISVRT